MDSPNVIRGQVLYGTAKTAFNSAGTGTNPSTVWAPASGRQIRLSHLIVDIPGSSVLGAAGIQTITVQTASLVVAVFSPRLSNGVINGMLYIFQRSYPGGLLLPRGETLTTTLGPALAAGLVTTMAYGREE